MARPNPTLNVSTVNLSADSSAADAKFGPDDRGPLPPPRIWYSSSKTSVGLTSWKTTRTNRGSR